jgi:hypothetical protein
MTPDSEVNIQIKIIQEFRVSIQHTPGASNNGGSDSIHSRDNAYCQGGAEEPKQSCQNHILCC